MAQYKQAEFARKCGISDAYLTTMKNRGKVVLNEQKMIDDEHPVNQLFAARQEQLREKRALKKKLEPEVIITADQPWPEPEKRKEPKSRIANEAVSKAAAAKLELESEKQTAEIERTKLQTNLMKMQQEKMSGKLIPTDMVKGLFHQHFKSFTVTFKQATDILLTEIAKKARLNRNEKAEINKELIKVINRSVEDAIDLSKRDLNNLVLEYSQVKKFSR